MSAAEQPAQPLARHRWRSRYSSHEGHGAWMPVAYAKYICETQSSPYGQSVHWVEMQSEVEVKL